jgi:hypothetical protein
MRNRDHGGSAVISSGTAFGSCVVDESRTVPTKRRFHLRVVAGDMFEPSIRTLDLRRSPLPIPAGSRPGGNIGTRAAREDIRAEDLSSFVGTQRNGDGASASEPGSPVLRCSLRWAPWPMTQLRGPARVSRPAKVLRGHSRIASSSRAGAGSPGSAKGSRRSLRWAQANRRGITRFRKGKSALASVGAGQPARDHRFRKGEGPRFDGGKS